MTSVLGEVPLISKKIDVQSAQNYEYQTQLDDLAGRYDFLSHADAAGLLDGNIFRKNLNFIGKAKFNPAASDTFLDIDLNDFTNADDALVADISGA